MNGVGYAAALDQYRAALAHLEQAGVDTDPINQAVNALAKQVGILVKAIYDERR